MPTRISKDNFEKEVLQADKTVLADFYSDSCVPCKRLSPVLFALEEEYAEKLKIVKININFDSELAEKYEVQAVPTLVFFKNGEEVSRLRGAVKQAEIKKVIEKSV
ncbi:thioredoxin [Ruminococcus sp.]|uniref:thioredoxin n=1 Tax=Ruminococcus sp. TaxID=41978 RepID=UPI003AAB239F